MSNVGGLTMNGVGLVGGSMMVEGMPPVPEKAGVSAGFTKFASFTPIMATAGATGIVFKQMKNINKLVSKKQKGGYQ